VSLYSTPSKIASTNKQASFSTNSIIVTVVIESANILATNTMHEIMVTTDQKVLVAILKLFQCADLIPASIYHIVKTSTPVKVR